MTMGSDATTNQLMQDGIRLVREGRGPEAYNVFRTVTERDPNNEFAWIWISVTSRDLDEKKTALNRALEINPNSNHAKEALRNLEIEIKQREKVAARNRVSEADTARIIVPQPPPPPFAGGDKPLPSGLISQSVEPKTPPPAPAVPPPSTRPTEPGRDPMDDLRADARPTTSRRFTRATRPAPVPPPVPVEPKRTAQTRTRGTMLRLQIAAIIALLLIIGLGVVYYFLNVNKPNEQAVAPETPPVTTAPLATTFAPESTTVATIAPGETSAVTAVPVAPSTTVEAATTAPATTTAAVTTAPPGQAGSSTSNAAQLDRYVQVGRQSAASGDYKSALASLNEAIKLEPKNVGANLELGSALLRAPAAQLDRPNTRYDEALRAFKIVTDNLPTWAGGWAKSGEAYALKGDTANAIKAYLKSLELDTNGPERWLALAALYDKNNQPAEASYARDRARGIQSTPPPSTTAAPPPATTAPPTTAPR